MSSDVILLLRYGLGPAADQGRPLGADPNGFWFIDYRRSPTILRQAIEQSAGK